MATSKARMKCKSPEKDRVNIQRLVHDVMMYSLPKCGLPESRLPPTAEKENVYQREDFLEIAGVCTLRVALSMRDRWRRMFISRRNSSGFSNENISRFLEMIAVCCPLSYSNTTQSIVNATFALCNEIIMFLHHEDIGIDLGVVLKSTGVYITRIVTINPFDPVKIEGLFDQFEKVSWYAEWLVDFITNCATPYGAREGVSDLFFEHVKIQWKMLKAGFPEKPTVRVLRGYLGFLPDHLFEAIEAEDSDDSSQNLVSESGSTLSGDHESVEDLASSGSGAVGGYEENVSEQNEQSCLNPSELAIDDGMGRLSLGAEGVSQENQNVEPDPKQRRRKKSNKKKRC